MNNSQIHAGHLSDTLFFGENQVITNREVDVILSMEFESHDKNNVYTTSSRPPPSMLNWAITAHDYTIAFETVCHCIVKCGQREETVKLVQFLRNCQAKQYISIVQSLNAFNGMKFHNNMHQIEIDRGNFNRIIHA